MGHCCKSSSSSAFMIIMIAAGASSLVNARPDDSAKQGTPAQKSGSSATPAAPGAKTRFEMKQDYTYAESPAQYTGLQKLWGRQAPAIKVANWHGDQQSLDKLKGKIVLIDFWATWCGPCKAAIPHTGEIAKKYADKGVQVFGICNTQGSKTMNAVADDKKMSYPTAADQGDVSAKAYGVQWWPFYCVIDRNGVVRGTGINPDKLETVLDGLLAEQPSAKAGS